MLVIIFVAENTVLFGIFNYFDFYTLYFLKIALWLGLAIIIKIFPSAMFSGMMRLKETVISLAFILAVFHLLFFMIIGLLTSFAKNTFNLTASGIITNLVAMGAALVGGEMCRSFLINSLSKKKPYGAIIILSIIFALFNMSLGNIKTLSGNLNILNYITDNVFPQLTQNIAASCLAYLSGPIPAIIYLGIIRLFNYLSPYIPNPSEIPKLLFNVLFPLLSAWIILNIYTKEASEVRRNNHKKSDMFGWVAISAFSVALVWFSVGVFPVFPSVILTGSMEPKIMPGDIVLVEKATSDSVDVGDVVMYYYEDGINITHRIIKKTEESGVTQFVTKGDNNPIPDPDIVNSNQIKGRVIGMVPKLGKIVLYLRNNK
jgi:signal peptidase I